MTLCLICKTRLNWVTLLHTMLQKPNHILQNFLPHFLLLLLEFQISLHLCINSLVIYFDVANVMQIKENANFIKMIGKCDLVLTGTTPASLWNLLQLKPTLSFSWEFTLAPFYLVCISSSFIKVVFICIKLYTRCPQPWSL